MEIELSALRELCADDTIDVRYHAYQQFVRRGVSYSEVKYTILHGEIIEQYPTDFPYPSCLVLCLYVNGRPIHTVVSIGASVPHIITAYVPDLSRWEADFKTRKDNNT